MNSVQLFNSKLYIFHRRLTANGIFQELHTYPKEEIIFRDLFSFMREFFTSFADILDRYLGDNFNAKLQAKAHVSFIKQDEEGNVIKRVDPWLMTRAVDPNGDYFETMNLFSEELAFKYAMFVSESSGWVFEKLLEFDINRSRYQIAANRGECDDPPKLPSNISSRAVLSLKRSTHSIQQNIGENCFIDAVSIAGYIAEKRGREENFAWPHNSCRQKTWMDLFEADNFKPNFVEKLRSHTGVDASDSYLFENVNPGYFLTVLSTDGINGFHALRRFSYSQFKAYNEGGKNRDDPPPVLLYLLLYKGHYFPVHNIDLLLKKGSDYKQFFCSFCLQYFYKKSLRDIHMENCDMTFIRNYIMPSKGTVINFRKHAIACQTHPFTFYADSECYHKKPAESGEPRPKERKKTGGKSNVESIHVPYLIGFYLAILPDFIPILRKCPRLQELLPEYPNNLYKQFKGENCVTEFMESLVDLTERLQKLFQRHFKYPNDEWLIEQSMSPEYNCVICSRKFSPITAADVDEDERRVMHHDHWTGEVYGPAHNACNLVVQMKRRYFPVIFHNLKGYDCHVIMKYAKLNQSSRVFDLSPIAITSEKYMSLSVKWVVSEYMKNEKRIPLYNEIRFLDSMQFLSSSLASLIEQLNSGNDNSLFHHTLMNIGNDEVLVRMSKRKGICPHEYLDSPEKLLESSLPAITYFKSGLNSNEIITSEEYLIAEEVWNALGCSTLLEYIEFYMKIDILGLTDVFEKFRTDCLESYKMDPVFHYSLPGFGWAAMLRFSQIDIQLIHDYEMFCAVESGIRGGLTQGTVHYAKADNYYLNSESHSDPNDFSKYLFLFDANGLYSYAMTQPLPYSDLEWVRDVEELNGIFPNGNVESWPAWDGEVGYFLIVDLEYPFSLHDKTASYPLAPNHEDISLEDYSLTMISQFVQSNPEKKKIKTERKLMATLRDKKNYLLHYRSLLFYLRMGMKLIKVHAGIRFKQKRFMKSYIDYNIDQRIQNSNDSAKSDLYKKLNNAVFGKSQEQQRKHMNFKLACDKNKQMKLVGSPNYKGSVVFHEDLVGFYMMHKKITLKHPIYIGCAILDLSKLLMYEFFYDVIQPEFPDVSVIYTDTDSLLLNITGVNTIEKLCNVKNKWIDGSKMPVDHPLHTMENKGKLGYFKEEMNGVAIEEVVILRPKMYAIKSVKAVKKTAKGVDGMVIKKQLNFDRYYEVYDDETHSPLYLDQRTFRSVRHSIQTVKQNKKALTIDDNKRFWTGDNVSLPFGHYSIRNIQQESYETRRDLLREELGMELPPKNERRKSRPIYKYPNEFLV